jgi:hypothetical protein
MDPFVFFQRMIAGILTAGFFAHDLYYTEKYVGLTIASLVFLTAVLSFHILVFVRHAGLAVVASKGSNQTIERMRIFMISLTLFFSVVDCAQEIQLQNQAYSSFKSISTTILSLIIVVFPELVFKVIFLLKKK